MRGTRVQSTEREATLSDPHRTESQSWLLYACGIVSSLAMIFLVATRAGFGTPTFLGLMAAASAAYLGTILHILWRSESSHEGFAICLGIALLIRVPLLFSPSGEHDDIYRYIWDGRVQRLGYNPYVAVPSDPRFRFLHTETTVQMNNPQIPSPYPPGALLFFRAVTTVHESVIAFRLAMLVCDVLIVMLLIRWLAASAGNKWLALVYAWHPLAAFEGARNGHVDLLGVLFVFLSFYLLTRRLTTLACASFALAVSVKFLPIVLLPLFIKRVKLQDALLGSTIFLAL